VRTPSILILLVAAFVAVPRLVHADGWTLEIGPYAGYYDFDSLTQFEDQGMFGARGGVILNRWARIEAEFDEVYTRRTVSGSRARQISFALHGRLQPLDGRWSPLLFFGPALVMFDDADAPDAFGDAWDLGLGAVVHLGESWRVRAEWMLRRQSMAILRNVEGPDENVVVENDQTLWGRSLRVGFLYEF
jgi:hypothetical protein